MSGVAVAAYGSLSRNTGTLPSPYPLTIATWIQLDALPSAGYAQRLFGMEDTGTFANKSFCIDNVGTIYNRGAGTSNTGATMSADAWYYCALSIDDDSQWLYCWEEDGTLVVSHQRTDDMSSFPSVDWLSVGEAIDAAIAGFEARVWSAALTEAELEDERDSATVVRTSDLWAHYEYLSGDLRDDSTSNDYDLTSDAGYLSDWAGDEPTFGADGAIAGAATGVASTTGTLRGRGFVSGTVAGAATTNAALQGRGVIAGTIAGVASTVGALLARGYVAGVAAGAAVVSGTLQAFGRISGAAAGTASASGTLNGEAPDSAISGSAAASATVTATLRGIGRMSGASHGTSSAVLDNLDVFEFPARFQLRAGLVDTRPRISR